MIGKGKSSLDVKNTNVTNVLLFEGLNNNILTIGQINDRGNEVIFI